MVVSELRDNTFFAVIELRNSEDEPVSLDARPSDAIALALRVDCPIFVTEEVIHVSKSMSGAEEEASDTAGTASDEEWPDIIGEAGDLPM